MRRFHQLYILLLLTLPITTWAQLNQYGHEGRRNPVKKSQARIAAPALSLPFWDDFSFVDSDHPVDLLWVKNHQVLVNSGQAIQAPTINAATFDGLNENGTPYSPSPTDVLDFGYRDTLESELIKMTEVLAGQRNSVYLSFFYQAGGSGEPPDPNDFLLVQLRSTTGWRDTLVLRVFSGMDPTFFYNSFIQINKPEYYHDDFQFRFISFGRKSGRYDAWHIDYVYLNQGRVVNDLSFPDRSYFTALTPLFDPYYAMPYRHFKTNMATNTSFNSFGLVNLKAGAPGNGQPMNYSFYEKTVSYTNGTPSTRNLTVANATPILPSIEPLEKRILTLTQKPDYTALASADSIFTELTVVLETGDSVNTGFEPVDFYVNDTLRQSFLLTDYYAYDDGTAEYAAGLTTAGNYMAYRFDMKTPGQDTIKSVSFYFPYFAGTSASSMAFSILASDNGMPGDVLYEQSINVDQSANNLFREIPLLDESGDGIGVIVQDTFFISYREPATGKVRIGLDKSHDTGDRMYFRLTDTSPWQVNDRVTGSLMIRPRFGHAVIPTTGLPEEDHPVAIYPNPNQGGFYLKGLADNIHILTLTGQPVSFTLEEQGDEKKVNLSTVSRGVYILRYRSGQKVYTEKLIITQ